MNRDENAAHNILWAGIALERPECLRRTSSSEDENNRSVDVVGQLNDPASVLSLLRELKTEVIEKKLKNRRYKFHHEITMDGVSVSLLYSKVTQH